MVAKCQCYWHNEAKPFKNIVALRSRIDFLLPMLFCPWTG